MVKFSVVVGMYNLENRIQKCIESLHSQDFEDAEFILVDDGSTDNTVREAQALESLKDSRFTLLTKANGGQSSTRDYGLEHATGKYIWFVDGDDQLIDNSAITKIYNKMNDQELDALQFNFVVEHSDSHTDGITNPLDEKQIYSGYDFLKLQQRNGNSYSNTAWHYCYNREFLINNEIDFPISYPIQEDTYFTTMALLNAKRVAYLNDKFYNYNLNLNSYTRSDDKKVKNLIDSWDVYNDFERKLKKKDIDLQFLFDSFSKRYIAILIENFALNNPMKISNKEIIKFFKGRNLSKKDKIKKLIFMMPSFIKVRLCKLIYEKYM